ncbi:MAG: HDIG domain-containing metalloprotein [Anaerolineae bacterium]
MTLEPEQNRWSRLQKIFNRKIIYVLLAGLFLFAGSTTIVALQFLPFNRVQLELGTVAPQAILSPSHITYQSEVATEEARGRAATGVPVQYDLPDPAIAKAQLQRAGQIFDYLTAVRADPYGSPEQKRTWIAAITDLSLSDEVVARILAFSDQAWANVEQETLTVLDTAMRDEIRDYQIIAARRRLPTLLALDVPNDEASVVIAIAEDLVKPNTSIDEARTEEERQRARDSAEPVTVTYEQNQVIIRNGEVVKQRHLEALEALGLLQPGIDWSQIASSASLMLLLTLLLGVYIFRFARPFYYQPRMVWLLAILIVAFVGVAQIMVPGHTILPYIFPVAALSIIVAGMLEAQLGVFIALMMGVVIGFISDGSLELTAYAIVAGLVGIITIGSHERVNTLLWSGVYIALTNVVLILIFRVNTEIDLIGLVTLIGAGLFNGAFAAGLALVGFFVLGNLTGITTSIQLFDLSRPTQPLLSKLLRRAPGTYHHSLLVGNLAEQAAERIGANALLTRVGAYYHDIGKMVRPYFFVENLADGMRNVHDNLDPYTSTQIIISHVTDGLELARKHRLPPAIRAFIAEHHATSIAARSFYHRAVEEAGGDPELVDESKFRYPGPNPQSRETAILMLADATEGTVRAMRPESAEEIDKIVRKTIADKIASGQLNESHLSLNDLEQIRLAFVDILKGVFHPRIKYPEQLQAEGEAAASSTPSPEEATPVSNPQASAGDGSESPAPGVSAPPPRGQGTGSAQPLPVKE